MQTTVLPQIKVDNSILVSLKSSPDELAHKMKFYTAIALYQKRELSLGKAAGLLDMDRLGFIELLKRENIPLFDYSNNEMDEIFKDADNLSDILK